MIKKKVYIPIVLDMTLEDAINEVTITVTVTTEIKKKNC